ncbi:hypothetical protein ONZ45_g896 [Pleurotus djamor]|nr:hypothetical protein ONZ45_g896 [Pleurotus djamor]
METTAFASLGVCALNSSYTLFPSACCPDKDLVVLVSRLGTKDRISLWKVQGPKIWDIQVASDIKGIVGLAWSPDGQTIAVAHDPPKLTLHSLQDGHQQRSLPLVPSNPSLETSIIDLWWLPEGSTSKPPSSLPRRNVITGSAHSILKLLPLLDHFQEQTQASVMDLFAFQSTQTRVTSKDVLPDFIKDWPGLDSDPQVASMSSTTPGVSPKDPSNPKDATTGSILVAADTAGHLFLFLDGSYPLGSISLNGRPHVSLFHHGQKAVFLSHATCERGIDSSSLSFHPTVLSVPLLDDRKVRDVATSSTSARRLVWYIRPQVVLAKWDLAGFGRWKQSKLRITEVCSLSNFVVRTLMASIEPLETESTAILDLTRVLLTGRSTDPLNDLLGSGEQMSERGIQKWETTVTEALIKIRDFAEKRITPALQRLHLILEEVKGWSLLPQYVAFELSSDDLDVCCKLCARGIIIASWLVSAARRELRRFSDFIAWLRFAVNNANPGNDGNPAARFDVLEVNNYFISGLQVSPIDKWFIGLVPQFTPNDLGVPEQHSPLQEVLERARKAAKEGKPNEYQRPVSNKELDHIDRNIDALVQELAKRCQHLFAHASGAAARSALTFPFVTPDLAPRRISLSGSGVGVRIIEHEQGFIQYFAAVLSMNGNGRSCLCLVRAPYNDATSRQADRVEASIREFVLPEGGEEEPVVDLHDVAFFDDESVVIIFQATNKSGSMFAATASYNDLGYQLIVSGEDVTVPDKEDMMLGIIEAWKNGHLRSSRYPVTRRRRLNLADPGKVKVAVNGRAGRRIACVLNEQGTTMETLDMEGDGEDIGGDVEEAVGGPVENLFASSKSQQDDLSSSRLTDVQLRKKKNADAQAAFRARRANYIATLEETVTSLESVVLQLQDSCRESRAEATQLERENARLRHEFRERESFWRALWQSKKTGHGSDLDDLPPPPSYAPVQSHQHHPINPQLGSTHMQPYTSDGMTYRGDEACGGQYATGARPYQNHSPSMPYTSPDIDASVDHHMAARVNKYAPYTYQIQNTGREGQWPSAITHTGSSGGESGPSTHSSHSPGYVESPTLTSSEMFVNRFPVEDQKVPLNNLDNPPYVFSNSRSLSPSSTPPSSSSTSLTSPFQFTFPPDGHIDRTDDYGRNRTGAEVTLHGGTADITSLQGTGGDGVRYRLGTRRPASTSDRTPVPSLPSLSDPDNVSSREHDGSSYTNSHRLRPRRSTAPTRTSHSPSPGPPPISGTLAVIKAQAFGALRRTRARTKKGSDGAARLAMDVLEARGIGMGVGATGSKRPRLDDDGVDDTI